MSEIEDTKTRRRMRYQLREISKSFETVNASHICTICQDVIENPYEAEVTSCGHTFHLICGHQNRMFKFKESLRSIRHLHSETPFAKKEIARAVAGAVLEYEIGKECPNCRQQNPFAYNLARKTTLKNAIYKFPNMVVQISAYDALNLAAFHV